MSTINGQYPRDSTHSVFPRHRTENIALRIASLLCSFLTTSDLLRWIFFVRGRFVPTVRAFVGTFDDARDLRGPTAFLRLLWGDNNFIVKFAGRGDVVSATGRTL